MAAKAATSAIPNKLLFLHGYTQNAAVFRSRTGSLRSKALKQLKYEVVFADAPVFCSPTYATSTSPIEIQKGWYNPTEDDLDVRPVDSKGWMGWNESFTYLEQLLVETEFLGVVGFSQGAAVAGILLATYPEKFRFGIFVSGFIPRDDEVNALYPSGLLTVPSLHIFGNSDPFVSVSRAEELVTKFEKPTVLTHAGGHIMPPKELLPSIKLWVSRFK
jgi:predicted esterase